MVIENIYHEVYAKWDKDAKEDDLRMGEQLAGLAEGIAWDQLNQEQLEDLLCKAALIGQKRGFVSGVRFWSKLIVEILV